MKTVQVNEPEWVKTAKRLFKSSASLDYVPEYDLLVSNDKTIVVATSRWLKADHSSPDYVFILIYEELTRNTWLIPISRNPRPEAIHHAVNACAHLHRLGYKCFILAVCGDYYAPIDYRLLELLNYATLKRSYFQINVVLKDPSNVNPMCIIADYFHVYFAPYTIDDDIMKKVKQTVEEVLKPELPQ